MLVLDHPTPMDPKLLRIAKGSLCSVCLSSQVQRRLSHQYFKRQCYPDADDSLNKHLSTKMLSRRRQERGRTIGAIVLPSMLSIAAIPHTSASSPTISPYLNGSYRSVDRHIDLSTSSGSGQTIHEYSCIFLPLLRIYI